MGIPVIEELKSRLHRAAIAGTVLLQEDFRLKRAIEQLEKPAAANPVFKKMYEQGMALVNKTAKCPQEELLDLIALVDAVLVTTAAKAIEGEIVPLQGSVPEETFLQADGSYKKQYRYSELMPLYQALTTKGSGRYEIVETAFKEKSGVLQDIRLRKPLIAGLADSYSEMVDLVKNILLEFGEEVILDLKQDFEFDGKSDMVRRLEVIEQIAGAKENEFYCTVVEKGKAQIRQRAIYALRLDKANIDRLLALLDTERGNVKKTVLSAFAQLQDERVNEYFKTYIKKNGKAISNYLILNDSEAVSDAAAEWIEKMNDMLKDAGGGSKTKEQLTLIETALAGMVNKTSLRMLQVLEHVPLKKLRSLKDLYGRAKDYRDLFLVQLAKTAIMTENQAYKEFVYKMLKENMEYFPAAFLLALRYDPDHAYDLIEFCQTEKQKEAALSNMLLHKALSHLHYHSEDHSYYLECSVLIETGFDPSSATDSNIIPTAEVKKKLDLKLDIRILQFVMKELNQDPWILGQFLDKEDKQQLALYQEYYRKNAMLGVNYKYFMALKDFENTDWRGIFCAYVRDLDFSYHYLILSEYKKLPIAPEEKIQELTDSLEILNSSKSKYYNRSLASMLEFKKTVEEYLRELKSR